MKSLAIIVAFLEFIIVTSLDKRHGVSLSLNAPNKIPIRGFLIDNNDDTVPSSKLKTIVKMMKSQQDQLNKIKAASKENHNDVSEVKSKLTNLSKAVHGSIKKVKDDHHDQLNKIKAASKENSKNVSAIKSNLTDLSKVVNGLKKATRKQYDGYIGCYLDASDRHLKHKISLLGQSTTLAKCREHCKGYKYTGLQYSTYCTCGNTLESKKHPKVAESDCNMACAGEPKRICGGSMRNSIYRVVP